MHFLSNLNWVDVVIGIIVARGAYIGLKRGIVIELFKLVGVLCAIFITLHYFSQMGKFIHDKLHFPELGVKVVSYLFLWLLIIVVFKLVHTGFTMLFHIEAHSLFDKWGGVFLSLLRAFLLCSLMVVFLRISGVEYLVKNSEKSYLGRSVVSMAPKVYEGFFYGFIEKYFPTEKLNKDAFPINISEGKKENRA